MTEFAGQYHVNFEPSLSELIQETKWLGRMGIDIPDAAQLLQPQEEKYKEYHGILTELLMASPCTLSASIKLEYQRDTLQL